MSNAPKLIRELMPEGFKITFSDLTIYRNKNDLYIVESKDPEFNKEFNDIDKALVCFFKFINYLC